MHQTTIDLGAGVKATAVFAGATDGAAEVLKALALPPHQAVLLLLGAADSLDAALLPRLTQFFSRGVARAALDTGAVVLDGGTQAGVMALMGQGVASRGQGTALVGVAPAALVAYPGRAASGPALEPHHSHFVLTEGDRWGSETPMLFQLAEALRGAVAGPAPALVLVVGGGDTTTQEVLRAVRLHLAILVLAGSGGLADVLAAAWPTRETLPDDAVLAEILAEGTLCFYPLSGSAQGLGQHIVRRLGADSGLVQAWETFAEYDHNANLQQRRFDRLQQALIWLGLVGAGLAIVQQLYAPKVPGTADLRPVAELWAAGTRQWWLLHHLLLLIPIALTVLVTAASRFKQGTKWLLLRGGAEAIKREIFRYRTRTSYYQAEAETLLTRRVEEITRRTMRTEVNTASLVPYDKNRGFPPTAGGADGDDGLSWLPASRYVTVRLDDQLTYYRRKAVKLETQLRLLSWLTFIVGGVGTYLAAVGQQVWIALTTAGVAALGSYLGYRQTESTLTKYNQSATDLANVRSWWNALAPDDQLLQVNIDLLVSHTEQVLQSNLDGWVQHMQNALAELHKAPPAAPVAGAAVAPATAPDAAAPAFPAGSAAFPPAEPAASSGAASADEQKAVDSSTKGASDKKTKTPQVLAASPQQSASAPRELPGTSDEATGTPDDASQTLPDEPESAATEAADATSDLTAEVELPDDGGELTEETLAPAHAPVRAGGVGVLAARAPGQP
ncbi:MAG: SLATT domain-containing protein [Janthinobacterium lividum]